MVELRKILFPIDLTQSSARIVPYVLSISEKFDSAIYLLHVDELHQWGGHFIPHSSVDALQKEALEAAEKSLESICREELQGCPNFQRNSVSGDAATEILKFIESEDVDLVVTGTDGRKG